MRFSRAEVAGRRVVVDVFMPSLVPSVDGALEEAPSFPLFILCTCIGLDEGSAGTAAVTDGVLDLVEDTAAITESIYICRTR